VRTLEAWLGHAQKRGARRIWSIGAYGFVMSGMQLTILAYLAIYLVDEAGMTKRTAGFAVGVALAGGTVGRIAWGWFSDRFFHSRVLTLQLVALGSALGLAALAVVGDLPLVWPALFLLGFCAVRWEGLSHPSAPVKGPLRWPNISDSRSGSGRAGRC